MSNWLFLAKPSTVIEHKSICEQGIVFLELPAGHDFVQALTDCADFKYGQWRDSNTGEPAKFAEVSLSDLISCKVELITNRDKRIEQLETMKAVAHPQSEDEWANIVNEIVEYTTVLDDLKKVIAQLDLLINMVENFDGQKLLAFLG